MAQTFLDLGYSADIIDWKNSSFIPKKDYAVFIDIHNNLERLSPFLSKDCIKILHITGAHWLFQNTAEYRRLLDLQTRRHISLVPRRIAAPSHGIEYADIATILGNKFTTSTFDYAKKNIVSIPISTTHTYPFPEKKNYSVARNNFIWLGGAGMVHKGLDLVLEAFASMPEFNLSVCGPVSSEKDFEQEYWKELYKTKNIRTFGKIDPGEKIFREITDSSIAAVFPSCSEGGGGSVITAIHAGLIPIVSREASVNVEDFGIVLKENTVEEIKKTVRYVSSLSDEDLSDVHKNPGTMQIPAIPEKLFRKPMQILSEIFYSVHESKTHARFCRSFIP